MNKQLSDSNHTTTDHSNGSDEVKAAKQIPAGSTGSWEDFFSSRERVPEDFLTERADDSAQARKELIELFGTVDFDPHYDYKVERRR